MTDVTPLQAPPAPAATPAPVSTPPAASTASTEAQAVIAAVEAIVPVLARQSWRTGEFWTPLVGAAGTVVAARVGVPGPEVAQVLTIVAPALLGGLVAVLRSLHKGGLVAAVRQAVQTLEVV